MGSLYFSQTPEASGGLGTSVWEALPRRHTPLLVRSPRGGSFGKAPAGSTGPSPLFKSNLETFSFLSL